MRERDGREEQRPDDLQHAVERRGRQHLQVDAVADGEDPQDADRPEPVAGHEEDTSST
jgi:hypothetical protein